MCAAACSNHNRCYSCKTNWWVLYKGTIQPNKHPIRLCILTQSSSTILNWTDSSCVSNCAVHLATWTQCVSKTGAKSVDTNIAEHDLVMQLLVEADQGLALSGTMVEVAIKQSVCGTNVILRPTTCPHPRSPKKRPQTTSAGRFRRFSHHQDHSCNINAYAQQTDQSDCL